MDRNTAALPGCYALAVLVGLLAGPEALTALSAAAAAGELTLGGTLVAAAGPILVAVAAVAAFGRVGAYAAAVLRGLLLGAGLGACGTAMGLLLHFTPLLGGAVLIYYLLSRRAWLCIGLSLAVGAVDYLWVAPFLRLAMTF